MNIGKLNQPQLYNYEYDQLNRLVSMQAYRNFNQPGNSWSGISATTDHQEQITYDGNGNITAYLRNGNTSAGKPLAMDNLGYHYNKDGNGNLLNNKLRHVTDGVTATANYAEDIDGQVTDNYDYEQIGNLTRDVSEQIDSIEWNVYGKISRIWKNVNATTGALQQISYRYDPSGNRISKTVYSNQDAGNYKAMHTWYVRDASGNVMATYSSEDVAAKSTLATGTLGKLYLSELHMYGSSRLGIWSRKVDMDVVPTTGGTAPLLGTLGIDTFNRGNKFFELSNHLGNVLVTVSDRKLGQNPVNGLYSSYTAEVVSASDYAPFGMQMVGRTYSAGSYRYGFNGKENDNEVKGEGNQQDYGMRIYDPRIGKFLSVDPLTRQYPFYTPYSFAGNKPIYALDLDGAEELPYWKKAESSNTVEHVANFLYNAVGSVYNGIAGTWNSGVKYTKTASSDGFSGLVNQVNDDYKEIKDGIVSDIKNTKASDFLNTENYWNAAEDFAGILLTRKVIQVSTSAKPKLQSGNHNSIEVEKPKSADHHIATNKNNISTARGGPWTPKFKTFFDKAGLDINKGAENLVNVLNHKGPHPEAYHQLVFDRLTSATQGLKANTAAYKTAVTNTLQTIGKEAQTVGSTVNKLLTKNP